MRIIVSLVFMLGFFLLPGCSTPYSREELAELDYGPYPSDGYEERIKDHFKGRLIDPTSPIYTFTQPVKRWHGGVVIFGIERGYGWRVCGTVNAKNRFGGYTGAQLFYVLIRHDMIVFADISPLWDKRCYL